MRRTKVVLIIEDEPKLLDVLADFIESLGHRVRKAGSAAAALKHADAEKPDLVLLDLGLPDMSGHALLDRLLANHPGLRLVIITGRDVVAEGVLNRAVAVIQKPVRLDMLSALIRTAFASPGP